MLSYTTTFSSFSVNDLEKAKDFYGNVLGLKVSDTPMGLLEIKLSGGGRVMIYSKPDHVPATFTVLNFIVEDVGKAVDILMGKGIRFEQYDEPIKTDGKGISHHGNFKMAWFKDPAGNILAILNEG